MSGNKRSKNAERQIARRPASFQALNQKNSPAAQTAFDFTPSSNGRCPPAQSKRKLHEDGNNPEKRACKANGSDCGGRGKAEKIKKKKIRP